MHDVHPNRDPQLYSWHWAGARDVNCCVITVRRRPIRSIQLLSWAQTNVCSIRSTFTSTRPNASAREEEERETHSEAVYDTGERDSHRFCLFSFNPMLSSSLYIFLSVQRLILLFCFSVKFLNILKSRCIYLRSEMA